MALDIVILDFVVVAQVPSLPSHLNNIGWSP